MPYKRITPWPREKMEKTRYQGHHSICETCRQIYKQTDDENIKELACMAMAMAKAMHNRLKRYKQEKEKWLSQQK